MSYESLADTIIAKSDRLNGEDLILSNKIITISKVRKYAEKGENKFDVHYHGEDGRPWKPCKTMRKIMVALWGDNPEPYIGRQIELYYDPSVVYAGEEVGGVRIKAMSDLAGTSKVSVTVRKGQKKVFTIEKLQPQQKPDYPADKFVEAMPAMAKMVESGKMTVEQVITKCEQTGRLSEEQRAQIRKLADKPEMAADEFFDEE